jgi:hypothetical protein
MPADVRELERRYRRAGAPNAGLGALEWRTEFRAWGGPYAQDTVAGRETDHASNPGLTGDLGVLEQ